MGRRVFLLTALDGKNQIVAYRPAPAGLEEAWRVEVPELTTLARDPRSRTVLALAPATCGLEVSILGPDPVDIAACPFGRLELGREVMLLTAYDEPAPATLRPWVRQPRA